MPSLQSSLTKHHLLVFLASELGISICDVHIELHNAEFLLGNEQQNITAMQQNSVTVMMCVVQSLVQQAQLTSAARSTMDLRFLLDTLCATSAANFLYTKVSNFAGGSASMYAASTRLANAHTCCASSKAQAP